MSYLFHGFAHMTILSIRFEFICQVVELSINNPSPFIKSTLNISICKLINSFALMASKGFGMALMVSPISRRSIYKF